MKQIAAEVKKLGFRATSVKGINPEIKRSLIPFTYPSYYHPLLKKFRRQYKLDSHFHGKTEFDRFLCLARWVNGKLHRGNRIGLTADPFEILKASETKEADFYCSHFSYVYTSCLHALGYTARRLGVDSYHRKGEDSTMHGTSEVYSSQYRKWILIDSHVGMYYTLKDGIPISAYEVSRQWDKNKGKDIRIFDLSGKRIKKSEKHVLPGRHESSAYHFVYIALLQDGFWGHNWSQPHRLAYYEDAVRKRQVWYMGPGKKCYPSPHYGGQFMTSDKLDDVQPDMGTIYLEVKGISEKGVLAATPQSVTPNFSHFLYRINNGRWQRFSGQKPYTAKTGGFMDKAPVIGRGCLVWKPKKGKNSIEVKPVNLFGREGAASKIEMTLR